MKSLLEAEKIFSAIGVNVTINEDIDTGINTLRVELNNGWANICHDGNVEGDNPVKHFSRCDKKSLLELWVIENKLAVKRLLKQSRF